MELALCQFHGCKVAKKCLRHEGKPGYWQVFLEDSMWYEKPVAECKYFIKIGKKDKKRG